VGVLLPADLPPGEYQLLVGMYDPDTLDRLIWLDDQDNEIGDALQIGSLNVTTD
jgi:hypothetical protein